jgi:hypothetical protein
MVSRIRQYGNKGIKVSYTAKEMDELNRLNFLMRLLPLPKLTFALCYLRRTLVLFFYFIPEYFFKFFNLRGYDKCAIRP